MQEWLTGLPGRVVEGLIVAGLLALGGILLGFLDAPVPLWAMLSLAVAVAVVTTALGQHRAQRAAKQSRYYAEHVREALESLQKGWVGELPELTLGMWIERGIMGPARTWLTRRRNEEIRMAVLEPGSEDPSEFVMTLESGHSVEARQRFRLPITGSFSGLALSSGETQWTNDVDKDPRWNPHPRARPSRSYASLVSVPIKKADGTAVGVFNVISTSKRAFSGADLAYIELLGALVNLARSMALEHRSPGGGTDAAP